MNPRRRFLVLSPTAPETVTNGTSPRVRHFVSHLASSDDVTLVFWPTPQESSVSDEHFRSIRRISCEPPFALATQEPKRPWHRLRLGWPYPVRSGMQRALSGLLEKESFDACLVFHPVLLRPALEMVRFPLVVDLVDEPLVAAWRDLRFARGLHARLRQVKLIAQLARYERVYCPRAFACCVVSETEALSLRRIAPASRVEVIPSGVDAEHFRPTGAAPESRSLLFIGNLAFPPNRAAVLFFARHVVPFLEQSVPDFRWFVVGPDPPREVAALAADPRIVVTGYVEDVRPYLERCSVFVSPLVSGGGIKTKVLEAWAMAKPVVATPLGTAGLKAKAGVNVLIAAGPESFARAVAGLLSNPARARALGHAGRETILQAYSWRQHAAQLMALLHEAAGAERPADRP